MGLQREWSLLGGMLLRQGWMQRSTKFRCYQIADPDDLFRRINRSFACNLNQTLTFYTFSLILLQFYTL